MTEAKCFTNEAAFTVANKALQVVGGAVNSRATPPNDSSEMLVRVH
jgi:alkylation response protein AidB-like acyl-CoA dehydrogenase